MTHLLYWIHYPEHTDITSEGYVGVTHDIDYRISQHKSKKKWIDWDKAVVEVIAHGSEEEIFTLEEQYRPVNYIAWNIVKGGAGGRNPVKGKSYEDFYGIERAAEERAKRSKAVRPKQSVESNKKRSDTIKKRIAEGKVNPGNGGKKGKKYGPMSEEGKRIRSEAAKRAWARKKKNVK